MNYPVKECLNEMTENDLVDMEDPATKFAVSFVTLHVCNVGVKLAVDAWNHRIPGIYVV